MEGHGPTGGDKPLVELNFGAMAWFPPENQGTIGSTGGGGWSYGVRTVLIDSLEAQHDSPYGYPLAFGLISLPSPEPESFHLLLG